VSRYIRPPTEVQLCCTLSALTHSLAPAAMAQTAAPRMPAYFVAHGGGDHCYGRATSACCLCACILQRILLRPARAAGPKPLLGDPAHKGLIEHLKHLPATLPRQPEAVLVVSAHFVVRCR